MVSPSIRRSRTPLAVDQPIPYPGWPRHTPPKTRRPLNKTLNRNGKGPGTSRAFYLHDVCLFLGRVVLAVLPEVNVVHRVLDVALGVIGERPDGRIVRACAQRF